MRPICESRSPRLVRSVTVSRSRNSKDSRWLMGSSIGETLIDFTKSEFTGRMDLEWARPVSHHDVGPSVRVEDTVMNQWKVEAIALAVGGHPLSRLRVTWHTKPGWVARVLQGVKSVERSATFAGTGHVWHRLPDWQRASPVFESQLREAESKFLAAHQELRVVPSQHSPHEVRVESTAAVRVPEHAANSTPDVHTRGQVEHMQPVATVHVHSKADVAANRRFRRMKLH